MSVDLDALHEAIDEHLPPWIRASGVAPAFENPDRMLASAKVTLGAVVSINVFSDSRIDGKAKMIANQLRRHMLRTMGVGALQEGLKEVLDWLESGRPEHAQMVALELLEAFEEGCLVEREEA